jgi:hypothetical protein
MSLPLYPQRRGTARTFPNFCVFVCIFCFVPFSVLFVCMCLLYYCHRVATQCVLYYYHRVDTQLQLTNISYRIHFTSHPAWIPFPSPHLTDIYSTSNFLHVTSLITFQPLFVEIFDFLCTSKSLHFTSLHFTSLHFTSLHFTSLHFTSLHFTLSYPSVLIYLIFSHFKFASLHLSNLIPFCFCNSVTCFGFHFNNEYIGLRVTLFVISYIPC